MANRERESRANREVEALALQSTHTVSDSLGETQPLVPQSLGVAPPLEASRASTPAVVRGAFVNGRYHVVDEIASGGMGVVYLAEDTIEDRTVALKTVLGGNLSPERAALFRAEFTTMTRLDHPHVARVYDFEEFSGGTDFLITMEYVRGIDLLSATAEKSVDEILELVVQICRALSYMHSRNVVHYDLKPANLLVTESGAIKVLDFGLSGTKPRQMGSRVRGTPQYMAPEILVDALRVDHRFDLYSLGITLFQLLERRVPFRGTSLTEITAELHERGISFSDRAIDASPPWLLDLIRKLCAVDPSDRFRTANAVIEEINEHVSSPFELETDETKESYLFCSSFVGREREFDTLTTALRDRLVRLRSSTAPAFFVSGPSGVGKSRLLREVRYFAQTEGMRFIESNCYEGSDDELEPVTHVLSHLVALAKSHDPERTLSPYVSALLTVAPRLQSQLGAAPLHPIDVGDSKRVLLIEQLVRFVCGIATHAPLALYFNDLQWARRATAEVLLQLAQRVEQEESAGNRIPIALLGTYRRDEVAGAPIEKVLETLALESALQRIELEHLGSREVSRILESMLGTKQIPGTFADRIVEETGGNPLFVEEVMRAFVEHGSIYLEHGRWKVVSDADIEIATIQQVFLRRFSFLDDASRELLELLAVAGRPIQLGIVLRAASFDVDTVHRSLAVLFQRRMVIRADREERQIGLSHDGIRETAYANLDEERRRELHLRMANAIRSLSDKGTSIYELAHHSWHAGQLEDARRDALNAAERAGFEFSTDLAVLHYERAISASEQLGAPVPPGDVLWEKLGETYCLSGLYERALGAFDNRLRGIVQNSERALLLRKRSEVYRQQGKFDDASRELRAALELFGFQEAKSSVRRAIRVFKSLVSHLVHRVLPMNWVTARNVANRVASQEACQSHQRLGLIHYYSNPKRFIYHLVLSTPLAERSGDSILCAHMYAGLGVLLGNLRRERLALNYAGRALALTDSAASSWHESIVQCLAGNVFFYFGRWDDALELHRRARDSLVVSGDMFFLATAHTMLSLTLLWRGAYTEAHDGARGAADMMERTGSPVLGKTLRSIAGWTAVKMGKVDAGLRDAHRGYDMCLASDDAYMTAVTAAALGDSYLTLGRWEEALQFFERAISIQEENELFHDLIRAAHALHPRALAECFRAGSDRTDAEREELLERWGLSVSRALREASKYRNYRSIALTQAAVYAFERGRAKQSRNYFESAIADAHRLGSRALEADAYFERGRLGLRGFGGLEAARRDLERALLHYSRLGAELDASRCRDTLSELEHSARSSGERPARF